MNGNARIIARILVLTAALALGACGFHLRGQAQLPEALRRVHVEINASGTPLARDLPPALQRSGATLEEQTGPGIGVLRVPVAEIRVETLSVGATARVREYTIRYHAEIEAVDANGAVVLPRQAIDLSRDYTFDETQALGVAAQEEEFRKQLERDMVQAILRRIEAAGRVAH